MEKGKENTYMLVNLLVKKISVIIVQWTGNGNNSVRRIR